MRLPPQPHRTGHYDLGHRCTRCGTVLAPDTHTPTCAICRATGDPQ